MAEAVDSFDVVIVGGGAMGCAAAAFLLDEPAFHGRVAVVWDGSGTELRRARVTGPATVTFADPVRVDRHRGRFVVRSGDGVAVRDLGLRDGLVLEVHR